jgi:hypothetical protein
MERVFDIIQRTISTPFLRIGNSTITLSAIAQFFLAVLLAIALALLFKRFLADFTSASQSCKTHLDNSPLR